MNPRPNVELMCFLHAYSRLGFRAPAGSGPPTVALASKISNAARGSWHSIPDLTAPLDRGVSEKGLSGDVLSLQLLRGLSVIYCTSIRQQERSYFRHLNCSKPDIKERRPQSSARLPTTSTRCQNRSAPIVCSFNELRSTKLRHLIEISKALNID